MSLSHLDEHGNARMVDISDKPPVGREAWASGKIYLKPATITLITKGEMKKGDVLAVARIAGIQASKRTSDLIPLCHQVGLTNVSVDFVVESESVAILSHVACTGKTGVEMEALTAVSVAALAVYDMCKAVDKDMRISEVTLVRKIKENSPADMV